MSKTMNNKEKRKFALQTIEETYLGAMAQYPERAGHWKCLRAFAIYGIEMAYKYRSVK